MNLKYGIFNKIRGYRWSNCIEKKEYIFEIKTDRISVVRHTYSDSFSISTLHITVISRLPYRI